MKKTIRVAPAASPACHDGGSTASPSRSKIDYRRFGALRRAVAELEALRARFGSGDEPRKKELIALLVSPRFWRSGNVRLRARLALRLHESLLYLRAYPDDAEILAATTEALARFPKCLTPTMARVLEDEGLAGTVIAHSFDYPAAFRLARRYPGQMRLDWAAIEDEEPLQSLLPLLAGPAEELAIDDEAVTTRDWVRLASAPGNDLSWITERLAGLALAPRVRDHLYDVLKLPVRWTITDPSASRTGGYRRPDSPFFHRTPLMRRPADLHAFLKETIRPRFCARPEARQLMDLALTTLAARCREMYPISHAHEKDILVWPAGRGLEVVTFGTRPDRRLLLEGLWGFLLLKNGVPAGYGCYSALLGSAEVAFNIFETFRQGESAFCYASLLRVIHAHTAASSFAALKYQIGDANEEAIRSGAFWFYEKLGFLPHDPETLKIVQAEQRRVARVRGYRTPAATLRRIAQSNVFLHLARPTRAVLGDLALGEIGLAVTRHVAALAGADRPAAIRAARRRVAAWTGRRPARGAQADEYCLLLASLAGVDRWSAGARRSLGRVLAAKTIDSEREFVRLQAGHAPLRRALLALAKNRE